MNLFKNISVVCFIIILFTCILFGNSLPNEKPKDFNFIFNYGVGAKNQLNTITGIYTKDMINSTSITTNLILSDEEMNVIYLDMMNINILNYPKNYKPLINGFVTPYETYFIKIIYNGKEKNIYWEDETCSKTKRAEQLRKLFFIIFEIIRNNDEYKKLPEARGGYM